ncbi:MAG TPA: hypothetical protein VHW06_15220 [Streptosporangiaceae bacterium]|jgi:hypothetical protein|nr:hypothetical protein [Streptosporangiaceae bacterium]
MCRDGATWEPDLALTYRRASPGPAPATGTHADLDAPARRVIDTRQAAGPTVRWAGDHNP